MACSSRSMRAGAAAALIVFAVGGCSPEQTTAPTSNAGVATVNKRAIPADIRPPGNPLPALTTYSDICELLASTCSTRDAPAGGLPRALARALALPTVPLGQPCRTSPGSRVATVAFGGIALGIGEPVRPLGSFSATGVTSAASSSVDGGWLGPKTLWYVSPAYHGPALIRGSRIDAPGPVGFGEQPFVSALVIPPGPTVNEGTDGYRTSPGGIWVKNPGCYAVQIDGTDFSYVLIFKVVTAN